MIALPTDLDARGAAAPQPAAPGASALTVEEISTDAAFGALGREWRALADAHGEGLPFRTWEWNDAWWRWFPERSIRVRDELFVRAFRAPGGELVGVAPLVRVSRPGRGLPISRGLEFFGTDPYVTEIRGVVAHAAWRDAVHRALLAHLQDSAGVWDWIRWRGLPAGGDAEGCVRAASPVRTIREVPEYHLPATGTWEEFKASRPRNLKESLRKCYNSLKRDGHVHRLVVARTPAEVRPAVERFLVLHAARAGAERMRAHGNVFGDATSQGFLLDVTARLAARDAVRVFQLRIGDDVVAVRVAFALGGTLYLYFSGYDPAWGRYSVMTTTVAEAIQYAFTQGFTRVHLSTGTDESKLRWRPERSATVELEQAGHGPRAAVARAVAYSAGAGPVQRLAGALLGRRRQG